MKTNAVRLFVASLLGCCAVVANAAVIDFEADGGAQPNGFSASGHPGVTFSDTVGASLVVGNFGSQSANTNGLAAYDDYDGSKIRMDFSVLQTFVSLDFGNDDGGWADPTDRAWLEVFNGGISVGLVSMAMNLDDIMNQTISYLGSPFDRAEFWYGDAAGTAFTNPGLIEIIDNVQYGDRAVPDTGATLSLAVLGLLGVAAFRRRQIA